MFSWVSHLEPLRGWLVLWRTETFSKDIPGDFQRCFEQFVPRLNFCTTLMESWRCLHCCSTGILICQGSFETKVNWRPLRSISLSYGSPVAKGFIMRLKSWKTWKVVRWVGSKMLQKKASGGAKILDCTFVPHRGPQLIMTGKIKFLNPSWFLLLKFLSLQKHFSKFTLLIEIFFLFGLSCPTHFTLDFFLSHMTLVTFDLGRPTPS